MSQCLGLTARVPDIPQTQILDDTVGIKQYSENESCWSILVAPQKDFEPNLNHKISPLGSKKPPKLGQTQKQES